MFIKKIYTVATDPVHIGTGGYSIGRVDNTIVRDPSTRLPKIPGTSFAGTFRLKLHSYFKEEYRMNRSERSKVEKECLWNDASPDWVTWEGNRFAAIKCAGQDEEAHVDLDTEKTSEKGHCGKCIVCHTFGFSKKDKSQQGRAFFSDLSILLFPVSTIKGVKWVSSPRILSQAGFNGFGDFVTDDYTAYICDSNGDSHINLGWIYLKTAKGKELTIDGITGRFINANEIILVSDSIISQIVNANLEVRTSVSIDPLTGAAKAGALFTSEAIPRGTVFYGDIRITNDINNELSAELIENALQYSSVFYKSMGIGGMVTRGFGRMEIIWYGEEGGKKYDE